MPEGVHRKVSFSQVAKWMLRNADGRCTRDAEFIFFIMKRHLIQAVNHAAYIKVHRNLVPENVTITVDRVKDRNFVKTTLCDGEVGYEALAKVRGSPAYWAKAGNDVFAMIRRLGPPTWFYTLSMCEKIWHGLIATLQQLDT